MKRIIGLSACLIMIMAAAALLATGSDAAEETFTCVAADKLDKTIAMEAQLVDFVCFFKRWKGLETLHFKLGVKNVSDKDQRFRVNIFLDNGKAVGGLLPRKTAKGLVKPGQTATFTYPVPKMTEKPGEVLLLIKTISE
jgi:hypothetical protein